MILSAYNLVNNNMISWILYAFWSMFGDVMKSLLLDDLAKECIWCFVLFLPPLGWILDSTDCVQTANQLLKKLLDSFLYLSRITSIIFILIIMQVNIQFSSLVSLLSLFFFGQTLLSLWMVWILDAYLYKCCL